jgi:hypothetical protein
MTDKKNWLQLLAYVTGSINQELLLRNEYLAAENHILKSQIKGRLRLSDGERATLAGIAKRLGRKALQEIACIAKPDTILAWYRKLVAQKFDGSKKRGLPSRPRVDAAIEELVMKLARENSGWGYDRIVGVYTTAMTAIAVRRDFRAWQRKARSTQTPSIARLSFASAGTGPPSKRRLRHARGKSAVDYRRVTA